MSKKNFEVYYEGEYYTSRSKVYYIDPNRDRFLITDNDGYFKWVFTKDCQLIEEE